MYQVGAMVIYGGEGVCRVEAVGPLAMRGVRDSRLYYTLAPLYREGKIYTPVDTSVFMRPVLSREEAEELVRTMPDIEAAHCTERNPRVLGTFYQDLIRSRSCVGMVQIIKTAHRKTQARRAQGSKPGQVDEKYLRREMILGLNKLLACSLDETMDIADTLIDAHNLLDRLEGEFGHNDHMRDMDALMTDTMEEAEQRIAKSVNGITGIPTGLTDLNRMTSGLQNGELIAIAARPSVGKTAFALHLARQAAMQGHAVAVYSLEMQGERLADRWLLSASDINPYRWRTGIPNPHEVAEAHTTAAELARLPIHVDDSTSISMDHVRSSARLLKSKSACDLIIIDYLQLCDMNTGQKNRNREQEVAQATRKAKLLAKELNVPVVLLCQLNRESEGRPGGRPELFHLRESGAIEQDADVVMLLYRPALARLTTDRESGYPTEGLGVVIVAKQRNGETGNAYFSHNPSLTKITDYTPPLEVLLKQAK